MIRPLTLITLFAAAGAGMHLYSVKHSVMVLDKQLVDIQKQTDLANQRTQVLTAEWARLNEPDRLNDMATRLLALQPMKPTQFVRMADAEQKLPVAMAFNDRQSIFDTHGGTALAAADPVPAPVAAPPVTMAAAAPVRAPQAAPAARASQMRMASAQPGPMAAPPVAAALRNDVPAVDSARADAIARRDASRIEAARVETARLEAQRATARREIARADTAKPIAAGDAPQRMAAADITQRPAAPAHATAVRQELARLEAERPLRSASPLAEPTPALRGAVASAQAATPVRRAEEQARDLPRVAAREDNAARRDTGALYAEAQPRPLLRPVSQRHVAPAQQPAGDSVFAMSQAPGSLLGGSRVSIAPPVPVGGLR